MVELDVRRTGDGALVVHHDAALDTGDLIVQLSAIALPAWIPTLADALAACDGMTVNVEIKNSPAEPDFDAHNGIARMVVDEIERVGWLDRVLVSSFNLGTIDAIRERVPTGWLLLPGADVTAMIDVARERGHDAIHPHDSSVSAEAVAAAHAAGLRVNTWTVDDHARIGELASWDIDGIVTNVPDEAVELVRG
jgi:glycerophosphoryl diester phosphodiesterase